jgi:hypothetical protein
MDGIGEIILSEVSQVQKDKVLCFLSYVEDKIQYKHKHYHLNIEIYTEHVSKSGTIRGD